MALPTPEELADKDKQRTVRMLITTLLFMVAIGLIAAFDFQKIKLFISHAGVWGILISIIVYGLLGFTLVPSEPLTLLIAAMFGPWVAMIASFFGNTLFHGSFSIFSTSESLLIYASSSLLTFG